MFEILSKYRTDHFIFRKCDLLEEVCNAPKDSCGIFLVYELNGDDTKLVYIGSSINPLFLHKKPGLFEKIVNLPHYNGMPGKVFFYMNLLEKNADGLNFRWYETTDDEPEKIANLLVSKYAEIHGHLPEWNI